MRILQKIINKIFFLCTSFWNTKEPRVINKADAKESELHLIHILREQNAERILLICDADFKSQISFTKLKERMQGAGLKLFLYSEQIGNPSVTLVEHCVHLFFSNNCQAILAIGGGSIIDLAKATKARIIRPEKSLHKLNGLGKIRSCNKTMPVLITSPTTITASESSKVAWIVDHTNQIKFIFNDGAIQPNYVMHCAEYVSALPDQLLAGTSCGTLAQAFEALLSTNNSAYINQNASEAISEILDCLGDKAAELADQKQILDNIDHPTTDEKQAVDKKQTVDKKQVTDENQAIEKKQTVDENPTIAGKNQMIEVLLNSAFKAGNAAGRSGAGYITSIANALAVFADLPYSDVAMITLPIILEEYLNLKPALFTRLGNTFAAEKVIAQINELSKTRNFTVAYKQTKIIPMREISEYVKKDIGIHSPPLMLSDEKLDQILQKISQRIFD